MPLYRTAAAQQAAIDARTVNTVAATVTASGALAINQHNPVDATAAARNMTLANASAAGQVVSVEKTDASKNPVTITANIGGAAGTKLTLQLRESIHLVSKSDGSWWPTSARERNTIRAADYGVDISAADNAAALNAAMAAAAALKCEVELPYAPDGINVLAPINFSAPIRGLGPNATRIKVASGFVGTYLFEMNTGSNMQSMKDLKLDFGFRPVTALGSSGDGEGPAHPMFENVFFTNADAAVYAVTAASTTVVSGMLTGAVFLRCRWENVAHFVSIGQNQDDIVFIGCRFMQTGTNYASDAPFKLYGQNATVIDSFAYFVQSTASGDRPMFKVGSQVTLIRGLFIECTAAANYTHIFYTVNPNYCLSVEGFQYGLTQTVPPVAIFRANLAPTTTAQAFIRVSGVTIKGGQTVASVFEVYSTNTSATPTTTLEFSGVDGMTALFALASGSVTTYAAEVALRGIFKGVDYAHNSILNHGSGSYLAPLPDATHGLQEVLGSTSTVASPATKTITLPSQGVFIVTVNWAVAGSYNNSITGTWLVYNLASSLGNVTRVSQQIGASQAAGGNAANFSALTLSNPASGGVLTATATWGSGSSYAAVVTANCLKIAGTGYLTN